MKYMKDVFQQKENEISDKYKKNVKLLEKYTNETSILQTILQNYVKKVKKLDEKIKHVPIVVSEELEASTKGKRDCTHFSYPQEEVLHKHPK